MAKHYSKVRQSLLILGLVGTVFLGTFTLTGCSMKDLEEAQDKIDHSITHILNSENIQEDEKALFSKFTFLCADVEKADGAQYSIDINGIAKYDNSDQKAYTTFNYLVSDSYFANEENTKNEAAIINTLADIVENENYNSYSISNVKNLDALNDAMGKATESPLDGYRTNNNFLYGVTNVQLSPEEGVASFSTKELTKFSRTRTEVTYGIIGYFDGKPKYGPVTRTVTDYESFFIDNNVYVKLTPEEMEQAKTNESIVFEKFAEYVKEGKTDKFVIQQTNITDQKQYDANMKDHISFRDIDKGK